MKRAKIIYLAPYDRIAGRPIYPITQSLGETYNELLSDYRIDYIFNGGLCSLTVPRGFVWDGASVPRVAWSLTGVTPEGVMLLPSLVHDILYRSMGLRRAHGQTAIGQAEATGVTVYSRADADAIFAALMRATGEYNAAQVWVCWSAVRAFGGRYWGGPAPDFNHKRR